MVERILIAGAGGQGILLVGKILAEAAMREGRFVTWLPAYGAEVRGGTAHCMVVISDEEIASPFIETADCLIAMNEPSFVRFSAKVRAGGLVLINSSLIPHPEVRTTVQHLAGPFTETAAGLGNIKVANMIALGSLIARRRSVCKDTVLAVIRESAPAGREELITVNVSALAEGVRLASAGEKGGG